MPLYQPSVLKQQLKLQDQHVLDKAYKKYTKYFLNPTIQDNIRSSKEEEYQGIFLTELFVNILGYTLKPKADFNLVAEYKNQNNARKADGAILNNDVAIGVIELKGTNTKDLESIRKQAFDYKANQKGCVYVITSNFEKLRFYINDATEFEEFNLFELPLERFELLYLCLQKDNVLHHIPLNLKEASLVEEEKITKQFYKDYSLFKRELYRDLVKRNAKRLKNTNVTSSAVEKSHEDAVLLQQIEKNVKLTLFKKSQKLIDRFLFIFFAEDRGLLPPNSTIQIIDKWKADVDFGDERPLYNLFKQYFKFLDQGRQGTSSRAEIYAYNGGLFKEDTLLDSLELDDALLSKHTYKLASYDFESQVDVNILGHIFENSLNEIESVNAEIEGGDFDKQKSKRKKDGVFYTPKYITKYIVENTVGKLCNEKKLELGFKEEEYFKGRKNRPKATITKLVTILDTYRDWLLQLTICDPACGSGAFLNQALDFLIKEHNYIDELKTKVLGGGLQFPDIENTILENNIYGVDLNEESVEIAKLSLWLRTAQPRRKLNDLSSNIKCGNSLIESKTVAGDKAFNWQEQFPKVFINGGFDVVIGNPPYVQLQKMKEISLMISKLSYETYESTGDLYCLFYEKGNDILKKNGILGYITSNKWMRANYGAKLRSYLFNNVKPLLLVDLGSGVFESAVVDSNILIFLKDHSSEFKVPSITTKTNTEFRELESYKTITNLIEPKDFDIWSITDSKTLNIKKKLENKGIPIEDWDLRLNRGIVTGFNEAFIINKRQRQQLLEEDSKSIDVIKPILRGRDIKKYNAAFDDLYLLYIPWNFPNHNGDSKSFEENESDLKIKYPAIYKHLLGFKEKLSNRNKAETGIRYEWYVLQRWASKYYEQFDKEKIIFQEMVQESSFSYHSESTMFCVDTGRIITGENLKVILGILNSKLFFFAVKNYYGGGKLGNKGVRMKHTFFQKFPLIKSIINNESLEFKVDSLIDSNKKKEILIKKFIKYLNSQFNLEVLTKKLQNWHELEFGEFIKELNKAIKTNNKLRIKEELEAIPTLTKKDEFEWLELFEDNKQKAQKLQNQINQTDKEIDAMVYELYGLTDEEIKIVEGS